MRSRILAGTMMHSRRAPVEHTFRYPVYLYAFDVDELEELQRAVPLFGYNRARPVSLWDKDHLPRWNGTLSQRIRALLQEIRRGDSVRRIELVTAARYFGYVFNPVSFWYCYGEGDSLELVIAEVNNTFGETHLYIVEGDKTSRFPVQDQQPRQFHVSPFNDKRGDYAFYFSRIEERMDIRINIKRDGGTMFYSQLLGTAKSLTSVNLTRTLLKYPLTAALTMPRILWQAAILHYRKKLPVYTKPNPTHPMTIRVGGPSILERFGMNAAFRFLSRLRRGALIVELPDGTAQHFGDIQSREVQLLRVRNYAAFRKMALGGDIGFGEAFVDGDWDTPDLTALLRLFIDNQEFADDRSMVSALIGRIVNRLGHRSRRNTRGGSRRNISAHYDLSNDLYKMFLDPTMMYSSAIYRDETDTLEEAQRNKIRILIEKARIEPTHHVLEVGSGWGTMAIEMARQTGCRVTTVTLSKQQYDLVAARIAEAGLQEQITLLLCDYRDLDGQYDRIVSIEMIEAVGHEYLGTFFHKLDSLLKPDGLIVLQGITTVDQRYESYRRSTDWIQKYVFPGAICPSTTALMNAMTADSRLQLENLENYPLHYARTLQQWRSNFLSRAAELEDLGFDERFRRLWQYYLCYCEAGFASRVLGVVHLVLTRPNNRSLSLQWSAHESVAVDATEPLAASG